METGLTYRSTLLLNIQLNYKVNAGVDVIMRLGKKPLSNFKREVKEVT